jgi:hypothetical protein
MSAMKIMAWINALGGLFMVLFLGWNLWWYFVFWGEPLVINHVIIIIQIAWSITVVVFAIRYLWQERTAQPIKDHD